MTETVEFECDVCTEKAIHNRSGQNIKGWLRLRDYYEESEGPWANEEARRYEPLLGDFCGIGCLIAFLQRRKGEQEG